MAGVEASLRAELGALEEKVSVAAERERTMAGVEALLRAELGALEEQVSIAAERERALTARHAGQIEQMQAAMNILRARLALHEQDAAKRNYEIAEHQALVSKLQEQVVRRLASSMNARNTATPRELRGIGLLISRKKRHLARDYCVVASSPLFDCDWYLQNNPDVGAKHFDPVLHYLRYGAAEGRQPSPLFDTREYILANPDVATAKMNPMLHFLKYGAYEGRALKRDVTRQEPEPSFDEAFWGPYYAAAGQRDVPLLVWRDLPATGAVLPTTREAAEAIAAAVRQNPFFDAQFYERRLPKGMDPALHYAIIGESLGWAPSKSFDPQFYLTRYPDLKAANVSPLMHFQNHGKAEGRRGVPSVQRLTLAPLEDERQPILVICHEASRTGAPILGWNLIRDLRKKHPVVTLLMRGGVLEKDFAAASDVVVGPLTDEEWHPAEAAALAERIVQTYRPLYAVANSIETSLMVPPLGALGVPSVALVHEFASYTRPLEKMRSAYDWAAHIVFPAQIVANSSFGAFAGFEQRRGVHVLAQGRQLLPSATKREPRAKDEPDIGEAMRPANEKDKFIVLGAATFISARASTCSCRLLRRRGGSPPAFASSSFGSETVTTLTKTQAIRSIFASSSTSRICKTSLFSLKPWPILNRPIGPPTSS